MKPAKLTPAFVGLFYFFSINMDATKLYYSINCCRRKKKMLAHGLMIFKDGHSSGGSANFAMEVNYTTSEVNLMINQKYSSYRAMKY